MNKKAFIFTMDAALALIPIFIVMASVSQISGGLSLYQQAHVLGGERIAQDVLEALVITDMLSNESLPGVNDSLEVLIPQHLNYSFELEFNGTAIYNSSRGNSSKAKDVMVAKRAVSAFTEEIVALIEELIRFGSESATPCFEGGQGKPKVYNMSFYVGAGDKTTYDYWLVVERSGTTPGQTDRVETCPDAFCGNPDCDFNPATKLDQNPLDQSLKYDFDADNNLTEGTDNWVYIRLGGKPGITANFYVIKVPTGTSEEQVSPLLASRKWSGIATLKVWGDENG